MCCAKHVAEEKFDWFIIFQLLTAHFYTTFYDIGNDVNPKAKALFVLFCDPKEIMLVKQMIQNPDWDYNFD